MPLSGWLTRALRRGPRCAVVTPVGPGHESFYRQCEQSVAAAWRRSRGPFSALELVAVDDGRGELGRSRARNQGVREALQRSADWVFFLDADDLMVPEAFDNVVDLLPGHDAVWGLIASRRSGDSRSHLRIPQILSLERLAQLVLFDPFLTLQMGHFVRTEAAAETPFDEALDAGEDFDYYLRLWGRYRCIKAPRSFFVNRLEQRSTGPRRASAEQWGAAARKRVALECERLGVDPADESATAEKNRCAVELQAFCRAHDMSGDVPWEKLARAMPFRGHHRIEQYEGQPFVMFSDNDDDACLSLAWTGEYRDVSSRLWQQLAKSSRAVLDIGAGTGFYALLSARVASPAASIYCIEPDAGVYERLTRNVELNGVTNIIASRNEGPTDAAFPEAVTLARIDARNGKAEFVKTLAIMARERGVDLLLEAPAALAQDIAAALRDESYAWIAIDDDARCAFAIPAPGAPARCTALWATRRTLEEARELLRVTGGKWSENALVQG